MPPSVRSLQIPETKHRMREIENALYDPYGVSSYGIAQVRQAKNNGGDKRDREDFVLSL